MVEVLTLVKAKSIFMSEGMIVRTVINTAVVSGLAVLVAGCTVSPELMETLNTPPMARGALLESEEIRSFTFPKQDYDGKPVTRSDIQAAIERSFINESKFDPLQRGRPVGCAGSRIPTLTRGVMFGFDDADQRQFNRDMPSIFEARYQNYTRYGTANVVQGSSINIEFAVDYGETDDQYTASFRLWRPASEKNSTSFDPSCGRINPLGTVEEIQADAVGAITKMNPAIVRRKLISGELDVPFPSESVAASFTRFWDELPAREVVASFGSEAGKLPADGATYSVELNKITHPVHITVYPYRDGSKVVYNANYGYEMTGSGDMTYSEDGIAAIEEAIRDVAFD
ncbi:MAG: hypothetical protein MRY64_13465 [Hyphomonadaceae bacterium]|nr:hypothetical protein [Hyphomonadaceae bacterium]